MQAIEEAGDVLRLRAKPRASLDDDAFIQAQALGDVDASGGSWNAGAQFVRRLQGALIEADGGVKHTGGVGGVNLERSVMSGDDADASGAQEVLGDSNGQRGAFFGIGGGAEFIEQDQGIGRSSAGDEIN